MLNDVNNIFRKKNTNNYYTKNLVYLECKVSEKMILRKYLVCDVDPVINTMKKYGVDIKNNNNFIMIYADGDTKIIKEITEYNKIYNILKRYGIDYVKVVYSDDFKDKKEIDRKEKKAPDEKVKLKDEVNRLLNNDIIYKRGEVSDDMDLNRIFKNSGKRNKHGFLILD